jgi:hypothetical protein
MTLPEITCCIVCEGVREEIRSKHILFGVFGAAPYVQIGIKSFALPSNFWFAFFGGKGDGKFRFDLKLYDPKNSLLVNQAHGFDTIEGELNPEKINTTVFLGFSGILTGPGKYRIGLLINGTEQYSSSMQIRPME